MLCRSRLRCLLRTSQIDAIVRWVQVHCAFLDFIFAIIGLATWKGSRYLGRERYDNISQGERRYLIREDISYSVTLVGRNLRVFAVQDEVSKRRAVCKSVWEEIPGTSRPGEATHDETTHEREFDVIKHLPNAQVRGLPEFWDMQHAQIKDSYATTASFPKGGKALKPPRKNAFGRSGLSTSYLEHGHTQSEEAGTQSKAESNLWDKGRQRQLYRFVKSECQGLRAKINQDGFGELLPVVRDAMICYYERYKIPDPGQLQAGKCP